MQGVRVYYVWVLTFISKAIASNNPLYHELPVSSLSRLLASAMNAFSIPTDFAALLVDISTNVMRLATVGACGLMVIRDDRIVYRSYPQSASGIIDHLSPPAINNIAAVSDACTPTDASKKKSRVYVKKDSPKLAEQQQKALYHKSRCKSTNAKIPYEQLIHTDFFELHDGDLLIAGSDGLFSNLMENQILAFVRPVPDRNDNTLAIANNTCLGSWTSDDVDFISYYLSFLANNYATAENSPSILRYPFPPSPHLDDVTVLAASCSLEC